MKNVLITLFLLSAINAPAQLCFPGRFSETPLFDSADVRKDSNIVYAVSENHFTGVMQSLMMDVYYPSASADTMQNRPFILLIHGGAFLAGSRQDMAYECMEYARRGFVAATIDYRLGWNCAATDLVGICVLCQGNNFDLKTATYAAAQDSRAALRYISANILTWNADPNRMFIGGESAGSITAFHSTFWDQAEANAFCPWAVAAVGTLDTAGNALPNTWSIKGLIDNCGAIANDSSLMNNGPIPVISFHDQLDCVVPYGSGQVISCLCQPFYYADGSQLVHTRLTSMGVCTELNTVVNSLNHCSYPKPSVVRRSSCFIKRLLCNSCVSGTNTNIWAIDSCDAQMTGIALFGMSAISMTVAPNPATDWCAFRFSEPSRSSGVLLIYDAYGRLAASQAFPAMTMEVRVQTEQLAEGIYYAETEITGRKVMERFSVVR